MKTDEEAWRLAQVTQSHAADQNPNPGLISKATLSSHCGPHLLAVCPGTSYLTSLSYCFFTYIMRVITEPTSLGVG